MHGVQKVGLYLLLGLLVFSVVFALLPARDQVAAKTGARLQNVQLTLYAARDPDAVWRFKADTVTNDPVSGTTELRTLNGGKRLLREKNKSGQYTGREIVDATLATPSLTINNQDDLLTQRARLRLVKECTTIDLLGTEQNPVKIQQGVGFSAPRTRVNGPAMRARIADLQMDFDTTILNSGPMELVGNLDTLETCQDGRIVTQTE